MPAMTNVPRGTYFDVECLQPYWLRFGWCSFFWFQGKWQMILRIVLINSQASLLKSLSRHDQVWERKLSTGLLTLCQRETTVLFKARKSQSCSRWQCPNQVWFVGCCLDLVWCGKRLSRVASLWAAILSYCAILSTYIFILKVLWHQVYLFDWRRYALEITMMTVPQEVRMNIFRERERENDYEDDINPLCMRSSHDNMMFLETPGPRLCLTLSGAGGFGGWVNKCIGNSHMFSNSRTLGMLWFGLARCSTIFKHRGILYALMPHAVVKIHGQDHGLWDLSFSHPGSFGRAASVWIRIVNVVKIAVVSCDPKTREFGVSQVAASFWFIVASRYPQPLRLTVRADLQVQVRSIHLWWGFGEMCFWTALKHLKVGWGHRQSHNVTIWYDLLLLDSRLATLEMSGEATLHLNRTWNQGVA